MDRLTVKLDKPQFINGWEERNKTDYKCPIDFQPEILNKLGHIEDLEQQLGIGIVELFGLRGKTLYSPNKYSNKIEFGKISKILIKKKVLLVALEDDEYFFIEDLNKSWFLTLEQAQAKLGEHNA